MHFWLLRTSLIEERVSLHTLKATAKLGGKLQLMICRLNKIAYMGKNNLLVTRKKDEGYLYSDPSDTDICNNQGNLTNGISENFLLLSRTSCFLWMSRRNVSEFCFIVCFFMCERFQKSVICHVLLLVFFFLQILDGMSL